MSRTLKVDDRFTVVQRHRYGVDRVCILDTLTGQIGVFVDGATVSARCIALNDDPNLVGIYMWQDDRTSSDSRST